MSATPITEATPDVIVTPSRTACAILVDWANKQDHWARGIAREVIEGRQTLSEAAIDDAYRGYRVEKGLDAGSAEKVAALPIVADTNEQVEPLCLTSLDQVLGVNALAPNQSITFNPKLTILFGENASGKTGYVRVLKSIAKVRTVEYVLGNVREPGGGLEKSARLQFRVGAKDETSVWAGETGLAPFTRMNVFDTRAVALHVDDDLAYTYTPRDLALFRHVAMAIGGVKERLERDRLALVRTNNPFLSRFDRSVSFYPKIETLGPATMIGEFHVLANISPEEEAGRDALRERVDLLRSQSITTNRLVAKNQVAFADAMADVATAILAFDDGAYNDSVQSLTAAEKAHRLVSQEAFSGVEIPALLGPMWREMIEAGHRYTEIAESRAYPQVGDVCVYCRQQLDAKATALLRKYRNFSSAATRHAVDAARIAIGNRQRSMPMSMIADFEMTLTQNATLFENDPGLMTAAAELVSTAVSCARAIGAGSPINFASTRVAALTAKVLAQIAAANRKTLISDLTAKADERKRLLEVENANLRELDGRLQLRRLLSDLERYVTDAKNVALASALNSRFSPLQKGLTDASKEASERLVNEDFEKRFRDECAALHAPEVTLDFPGRKSEPARRKRVVPHHRLSEILSEGEQKVIALADFLAEATLRRTAAPIIFDDPVNSLDYRRSEYVAERVVDLAAEQQVVVFTHNIMLTVSLLEAASTRKTSVTYYDVKADDGKIGLISEASSPRVDDPGSIEKKIKGVIEKAEKEVGEMREIFIVRAYSLMRAWCEVFVEVELLKGVARRFEPNIRLHSLPNIKTDRLDAAITVVSEVFKKACRITDAHSQPLESLSTPATLDGTKADFKALTDARAAYASRSHPVSPSRKL